MENSFDNAVMCIEDSEKLLKPWKYIKVFTGFNILLSLALYFISVNYTPNLLIWMLIFSGLLVYIFVSRAFANLFANYKLNKDIYKSLSFIDRYNYTYNFNSHDIFLMLVMPVCIVVDNILHKEVKANKYRYQIICITKNSGETLYYAVVKKYFFNIREYIYPWINTYIEREEKYAYETYSEAKTAVETFKAYTLEKYNAEEAQRQKDIEAAQKQKEKVKKDKLEKRRQQKQQKFAQSIKSKVVVNCN